MPKQSNWVSAKDCGDFLEAFASERPGVANSYKQWLPNLTSSDNAIVALSHQRLKPLWIHPQLPLSPPPKTTSQLYEAIFRHKLRVVWLRAVSGESAQAAVTRLIAETREFQHRRRLQDPNETTPDFSGWCSRMVQALEWLKENTHRLRICGIAGCREFPYFVGNSTQKKYCTKICGELAEVARIESRPAKPAPNKDRLSPEGRKRISEGQKKKWKLYKAKKERSGQKLGKVRKWAVSRPS